MLGTKANDSIKAVRNVKLRPPKKAGGQWNGVAHGELVETVEHLLSQFAGVIVSVRTVRRFHLARGGADLAASWTLDLPHPYRTKTHVPAFGLITSNASRQRLAFFCGFDRGPLEQRGRPVVYGKHMAARFDGAFSLGDEVARAGDWLRGCLAAVESTVERVRDRRVSRRQAHDLLMRAGQMRLTGGVPVMPGSRVVAAGKALEATVSGSVPALELLERFGEQAQHNPPPYQMDQMLAFHQLVMDSP